MIINKTLSPGGCCYHGCVYVRSHVIRRLDRKDFVYSNVGGIEKAQSLGERLGFFHWVLYLGIYKYDVHDTNRILGVTPTLESKIYKILPKNKVA